MKKFQEFLESTKCPKGYRFDTKLKSCVPTKKYPHYPYGMLGRSREETNNGDESNDSHSGNGNGSNGHTNGASNGAANGGNGS